MEKKTNRSEETGEEDEDDDEEATINKTDLKWIHDEDDDADDDEEADGVVLFDPRKVWLRLSAFIIGCFCTNIYVYLIICVYFV